MSAARNQTPAPARAMAPLDATEVAQGFAAVGSEPRLEVLLALVRAGPEGLTVGEIQVKLAVPASTLAHHLRFLSAARLITQERRGRTIRNRAAYEHIESLAGYLLRECCRDSALSRGECVHDAASEHHATPGPSS